MKAYTVDPLKFETMRVKNGYSKLELGCEVGYQTHPKERIKEIESPKINTRKRVREDFANRFAEVFGCRVGDFVE